MSPFISLRLLRIRAEGSCISQPPISRRHFHSQSRHAMERAGPSYNNSICKMRAKKRDALDRHRVEHGATSRAKHTSIISSKGVAPKEREKLCSSASVIISWPPQCSPSTYRPSQVLLTKSAPLSLPKHEHNTTPDAILYARKQLGMETIYQSKKANFPATTPSLICKERIQIR